MVVPRVLRRGLGAGKRIWDEIFASDAGRVPFPRSAVERARIVSPERLEMAPDAYLDFCAYLHCGNQAWCPNQGRIVIGRGTYIGPSTVLFGMGEIEIGDHVMISPGVVITSLQHPIDDTSRPMFQQPRVYGKISIEDDVYIGSNAVVTPGVRIGRGAVVGAGAVVTKDIPPYAIAMGVPAKVVRWRKGPPGSV